MSFDAGKAAANETKHPFVIEVPVTAKGLDVKLNGQMSGFTSRAASRFDLAAPFGEAGNTIIVGAFPIWRRRGPLSDSLAERFTK
jgi:hypothetical protein